MKPVTFQAPLAQGGTVSIEGFPTTTPGLVVNGSVACPHHDADCFRVSHVRSGLAFPWCWASPEGGLGFAGQLAAFGSWHITGSVLARRIQLPYVRRCLSRTARRCGAVPSWPGNGDPETVDNGAIA